MKKKASTKEEFFLKLSTRFQAILELVLAGTLWGFGFVATVWALQTLSTPAIIFYRFFGAFFIGIVLLFIWRKPAGLLKSEALLTLSPGLILCLMLLFQTYGLQMTTATNSGFITTLYVIWVPLFRFVYHRERMGWLYWLSVAMALLGTLLILNWNSFDPQHLNAGDFLTLICSLLAAYHIIIVGKRAPLSQNDFAFNTFQSMWTALPCLLLIPISENFQVFQKGSWNLFALDSLGWIGMISLTLGSSLIAFFLQVRAQRVLSPSTASLLFLLESPVSFFFAFTLLGERLSSLQLFGAFLILLSCALISLPKR